MQAFRDRRDSDNSVDALSTTPAQAAASVIPNEDEPKTAKSKSKEDSAFPPAVDLSSDVKGEKA